MSPPGDSTISGVNRDTVTVLHVDSETEFSGGEVQVFLLMEGLRSAGYENILVCPPGSKAEQHARERGFDVAPVALRNDFDLPALLLLRRTFRELAPDVLHFHTGRATWLGGLAARGSGRPTVSTRRMDRRVRRNGKTRLVYGHLIDGVVAISEGVRACLTGGGVAPERVHVIHSAVDAQALRSGADRATTREELGLAPEDVALLTLASLVPRKGLDVLIEAFHGLATRAPTRLFVAGSGPERERLEAAARSGGAAARIRFLGRRADRAALLSAADIFVLPSRQEGLGVAALEAMAAGLPVVASRVGGLADAVVDGRTGRTVAPGEPTALRAALAELVDDASLRRAFGAAGPARVADGHSASAMVAAYAALYRSLLAGDRPVATA